MAKDKKNVQAESQEFDFSNAGFCFCAEVVALYGQVNYKQSADILMDQIIESSIDAGQRITSFVTVPEALRPEAAQKVVDCMDKTMFLAYLLVKIGQFREKDIDNLVMLARAVKRALLKYLRGNPSGPVIIEAGDDDGFYDEVSNIISPQQSQS